MKRVLLSLFSVLMFCSLAYGGEMAWLRVTGESKHQGKTYFYDSVELGGEDVNDIVTTIDGSVTDDDLATALAIKTYADGLSGSSPGGSDTHVQYNDNNTFGGEADFTYDDATNKLSVAGNIYSSSYLTSDRNANAGLLQLQRNTSITANGIVGQINFLYEADGIGLIEVRRDGADDAGELLLWTQPTGGTQQERLTIKSDGKVGINTGDPEKQLSIVNEDANATLSLDAFSNTTAVQAALNLRRAKGSEGTPGAVTTDDPLASINFGGHDGSDFYAGVQILGSASEPWTATDHGANIVFRTIENDTTTLVDRGIITDAGLVGIGTVDPNVNLEVVEEATYAVARVISYSDTTSDRGYIQVARADGTESSPAAIDNQDIMGTFGFVGHTGTTWRTGAQIIGRAEENWVEGSNYGSSIIIQTVTTGTAVNSTRWKIGGDGEMYLTTGAGVDNIVTTIDGSSTDDDLATALAIKTYADSVGGGTPGGSDSHVQYNDGGSTFGGNANFVYDDVNFRVGIGESSPDVRLHLTRNDNVRMIFERTSGSSGQDLFYIAGTIDDGSAQQVVQIKGKSGSTSDSGQLYFYTTDTGGSWQEGIRINEFQGIGIAGGTPGSTYALEVLGATFIDSGTLRCNYGFEMWDDDSWLSVRSDDGSTIQGGIKIDPTYSAFNVGAITNHPIYFIQNSAQIGAITTSDYWGIGETNLSNINERLVVAGGIRLESSTGTNTGTMRFASDDFEGYTSSGWQSFTAGSVAGSDHQVQYNNGGSAFGGDADFLWDDGGNRLILRGEQGHASNWGVLNIDNEGGSAAARNVAYSSTATDLASYSFYRRRGTRASPTAINSGDTLGGFYIGGGYGTGENDMFGSIAILAESTEAFSSGNCGGKLHIYTTDNTTATRDKRVTFDQDGQVGIGIDPPEYGLHLYGESLTPSTIAIDRTDDNTQGPELLFRSSDSASKRDAADQIGRIRFQGWDGDSYADGAYIVAELNSLTADGDMPTALDFYTTPDGTETPSYDLRITTGNIAHYGHAYNASYSATAFSDTATHRGYIFLNRADGTILSPGAIDNNDSMGAVVFGGYASTWQYPASITATATENFSASAEGCRVDVAVTANGATSAHAIMTYFGTGGVQLGGNDYNSVAYDVAAATKYRILYVDENGYIVVGDSDNNNND
jgi:hypothetical protein